MGSKFKIRKTEISNLVERSSNLNATTPIPKHDWSEKTAASWSEHTGFLERTAITGVRPPLQPDRRGLSPLIAAQAAGSSGLSSTETPRNVFALIVLLPILGASVYFGAFGNGNGTFDETIEAPAPPKIAKNPNKGRAVEPMELKLARLERALQPPIKLTTQPSGIQQKPAVKRSAAVITLEPMEAQRIRNLARTEPSLRALVQSWRAEAARDQSQPPSVTETFIDSLASDPTVISARIDLKKMRNLTMGALASGDVELAKRLRASVLLWSKTYRPLGDASSDVELEPVIEAYSFLQGSFNADEKRRIDDWLHLIADREVSELLRYPKTDNIYFAYHLKTLALIGFATGNANLQDYVAKNFPSHLTSAIESDGSTTTYRATRSIRKHSEHIQALLHIAVLLNRAGLQSQESLPRVGSTFAKSIDFAYPYLIGHMAHQEFEGARLALEPEHPLNPKTALGFLDTALYFRMTLAADVRRLVGQPRAIVWDAQSLYFSSMLRKTDDFEIRIVSPTYMRAPTSSASLESPD